MPEQRVKQDSWGQRQVLVMADVPAGVCPKCAIASGMPKPVVALQHWSEILIVSRKPTGSPLGFRFPKSALNQKQCQPEGRKRRSTFRPSVPAFASRDSITTGCQSPFRQQISRHADCASLFTEEQMAHDSRGRAITSDQAKW